MTAQPLVCPSCRTWFEAEGEMVRCPAYGSCFRTEGAILDRAAVASGGNARARSR